MYLLSFSSLTALALATLSALLAPGASAAAPTMSTTAAPPCGPYTLAFYELGLLYHHDAAGGFSGIDKDVVQALQARSRCKFRTLLDSRVRIWDRMAAGSLDLSVSGIPTPERERFADFVPYFQTRNFALMRKELAQRLPTPEAFLADSTRRVVVVKAFKHGPGFDSFIGQLREQGRLVEAADFDTVLRLFLAGRADLMLALPTAWSPMLQKPALMSQLSVLDWAPQDRVVHGLIMSRARLPETERQHLRQALESLVADGSIDAIFRRHVGERMALEMRLDLPPPGAGMRKGKASEPGRGTMP
ncbi:transporter substrate-binding domain-containing protein [Mitsuaria sp. WAJ17]|uniref:substrate-binding periplasmic protein n=1 Tax=Mitsuaria sp. WAJ17 TaxID=2761452 RepID=UPI001604703F|nr:transporter substrate-binding domain-containing protein [Mitsuaria sp. WAJ17]MBB2483832.1 transporter substrate-binding domain-containing protein [Mitsuaria sp. WAJ17]